MQYSSSLTAEQWMIWVNYYSLFCLYDIITKEHIECWRHFVLASRLLCKQGLKKDVELADALLLQFCRRFQSIYGPDAITPNIHLHAHLAECIQDYGPMSSFWLFSFERFNGILGDEPTNNRSIELQLLNRFVQDNSHIQLLSSVPSNDDITKEFSKVVLDKAYSFSSTKHLDVDSLAGVPQEIEFIAPSKYIISSFTEIEMEFVAKIYHEAFSTNEYHSLVLATSFKKMLSATIKGQKIKAGQYVGAKSVFQFSSEASSSIRTCFTEPGVRPAKVLFFLVHSVTVDGGSCIENSFAVVDWPAYHPSQHCIGKPFEVWCSSLFESSPENFIIPVNNIVTLMLTANFKIEDETVLVTVPLL